MMLDISVKNENLYDALSSLTNVILGIVSRRVQDGLVVTTESVWKKQNTDSYVRRHIKRPFWEDVLHKANDEINNISNK